MCPNISARSFSQNNLEVSENGGKHVSLARIEPPQLHEISRGLAAARTDCRAGFVREIRRSDRTAHARKRLHQAWRENRNQLPRYMDLSERLSAIPGSACSANRSVAPFRQYGRIAKRSRSQIGRIDRRRIRDDHFRRGGIDGGIGG